MGVYTNVFIKCRIFENTPKNVVDILRFLFDNTDKKISKEDLELSNHKFFTDYWEGMGAPLVADHPIRYCDYDGEKIHKLVAFVDVRLSADQICSFFDWIDRFIDEEEGQFIGYSLCEYNTKPNLFFKGYEVQKPLRIHHTHIYGRIEDYD